MREINPDLSKTKTKPFAHVKKGDSLLFFSQDGSRAFKEAVIKVKDDPENLDNIKIELAPNHIISNGQKLSVGDGATATFKRNDQVRYYVK